MDRILRLAAFIYMLFLGDTQRTNKNHNFSEYKTMGKKSIFN